MPRKTMGPSAFYEFQGGASMRPRPDAAENAVNNQALAVVLAALQ